MLYGPIRIFNPEGVVAPVQDLLHPCLPLRICSSLTAQPFQDVNAECLEECPSASDTDTSQNVSDIVGNHIDLSVLVIIILTCLRNQKITDQMSKNFSPFN